MYIYYITCTFSNVAVRPDFRFSNLCCPCLVTVAPSWRRWTRLKRCGCRSGNMKKTEHVPSTGRPSSRGWHPANAPRTALKHPPIPPMLSETLILLHLSSPGTSASSFINSAASILLSAYCFPPPPPSQRNSHVHVWLFLSPFFFFFFSFTSFPLLFLLLGTVQTLTFRGSSGFLRGQWLALWTLTTGPAYTII